MNKLSISSGAHMGLFNLGAVSELNTEIKFEEFFGVSIGGIIAGFLALGYSPEEIKEMFFDNINRLSDIYSFKTFNSKPLYEKIRKITGDKKLGDTIFPLSLGVTSKKTGENIILASKTHPEIDLSKAIFSSALLKVMRGPKFKIGEHGDCIDGAYSNRILNGGENTIYIDSQRSTGKEKTINITENAENIREEIRKLVLESLKKSNPLGLNNPFNILMIPSLVAGKMKDSREKLFQEGENAAKEFLFNFNQNFKGKY